MVRLPFSWLTHFGIVATLVGCASLEPPPQLTPLSSSARLSVPIILAGDNQEHEIAGLPSSLAGGAADTFGEVTIRQPLHGLFGRKLLEFASQQSGGLPLIHLGDLLDISCASEFDRIRTVLDRWDGPLAIAPGNHDGLLNGIFTFNRRKSATLIGAFTWNHRCQSPDDGKLEKPNHSYPKKEDDEEWSRVLSKDHFITRYVDMLRERAKHDVNVTQIKVDCGQHAVPCVRLTYRSHAPRATGGIEEVRGIVYPSAFTANHSAIKGKDLQLFTRSWILQRFRLPRGSDSTLDVSVILIDTTNIDQLIPPRLDHALAALSEPNPGYVGYVGSEQREQIRAMIERERGDLIVFAGHHHWLSINDSDRAELLEVMKASRQPLIYLSAHTHEGFWKNHRIGESDVLELNVSSLADWPVTYRQVQFAREPGGKAIRVIAGIRPKIEAPQEGQIDGKPLLSGWKTEACKQALSDEEIYLADSMVKTLVESHRSARGNLLHTFAVWMINVGSKMGLADRGGSPLRAWAIYFDSYNDLRHIFRAVAGASRLNPTWGGRLINGEQIDICKMNSIAECMDILAASLGQTKKRNAKVTRDDYDRAFAALRIVQNGISAMHNPEDVAYMACLSAIGAYYDWLGANSRPPLKSTFYWMEAETRIRK